MATPLGAAVLAPPAAADVDTYARSRFAGQLNTVFRVQIKGTQKIDTRLIELVDRPPSPKDAPGGVGESFSLVFRAAAGSLRAPQGTYNVAHAVLGAFPLLLVPMGTGASVNEYVAVIDRRTFAAA